MMKGPSPQLNCAGWLSAWLMAALLVILCGCAPGVYRPGEPPTAYPSYSDRPTGPGTIPRTWYDSDPALEQWFSPWYVNPYLQ